MMVMKWLVFACVLAFSTAAQAHVSAVQFPEIGSLRDVTQQAAFGIFQTALVDTPAVTTCNMSTGSCTGLDAGTGLFTAATCNGVANDTTAFTSFNTWARASTTNTNSQLIELQVSGTCVNPGSGLRPLMGLRKARVAAYGATFQGVWGFGSAGSAVSGGAPPGICQKGLADASGCSARIATVSAGASSVTLSNTALCSRFTTGQWAVVTGFDLFGTYNVPFGYPPDPHFIDYVQIVSTASCAGSGQITFSPALTNTYRSTWPEYNSGDAGEADNGGPATIYALDANWGGETEVRGAIISTASATGAQGRNVTYRDVTHTGSLGVWPSQNLSINFINFTCASCDIEVDKIVGTATYAGGTIARIHTQSTSVNNLVVNGVTFSTGIEGTPKTATISNSTIPNLKLGPLAYGYASSATCTNCSIATVTGEISPTFKGPTANDIGANILYTTSGGVMSLPDFKDVTGLANNGGFARLTVASTTGFPTGLVAGNNGILSGCAGTCPTPTLTVVDGTHFDTDMPFAAGTWTGAGKLVMAAPRWAVPGSNWSAVGSLGPSIPFFQVTGVTQDSSGTHIATTLSGGYPTVPLTGGKSWLSPALPSWTCTGCFGSAQAVDFAGAPAGRPLFSYTNRTWTNTPVTSLVAYPLWGKVTSITVTVSTAYTGATTPLKFNPVENTVIPAGTSAFWNPFFDLRTAGVRVITPAGVTCNGVPGTGCGTDSGLALPDPAAMFAANFTPQMSGGAPTDQPWTISIEAIMDQGVVP